MPLQNRDSLKSYFRKGQLPSEGNFHDLIDSAINKVDDGMSKTMEEGLILAPIGDSRKLLSFYKNIEDKSPVWKAEVNDLNSDLVLANKVGDCVLGLSDEGKVSINKESADYALDINGAAAFKTRIGNAYKGKVPADGKWHKVIEGLNGCHMLEIVAGAGKKKTGKYALLHALGVSTYGKSKNRIKRTQAYYGIRANRIRLRWTGTTYDFNLEIKTRSNYGENMAICYHIQELWDDPFMDSCVLNESED